MEKLKKIYAVTSVLFLIVLAVSPLKNYLHEWRSTQENFNSYLNDYPQRIKPVEIGLKQIWVRDLNRIDRCTTCHLGISNPKLQSAPEPFNTHPKMHHDMDKFGCTICHQGQGLATDFSDVHNVSEFWDRPMLPDKFIEASCGRCHINQDLKETPNLNEGRGLVENYNCIACHNLPGFHKAFVPSLDGIGAKLIARDWLVKWLKNPSKVLPKTKMPDFLLSDDEINSLADFLWSFKKFPDGAQLDSLPDIYKQKKDDDDFINLGKTRFREARCISCHAVEGRGGHLAVDLGKVASKVKTVWLYNYIRNPKKFQTEVEMPRFGFSNEEVAAVTAYIESEFVDWDAEDTVETNYQPPADFFEKGLAVFNKYNCMGCHKLSAEGITENKGPDLSEIGDKKLYQVEWGKSTIPHTLYDFIENKIKTPRLFGDRTRMPVFNLTDGQRDKITTYLLSLREKDLPVNYMEFADRKENNFPQGAVGKIMKKYSCLKCHSIKGLGGNIAPDLSIVGSRLQIEWMRQYFNVPYSIRPIVEERMPELFISSNEVDIILNYFNTVLVDDSINEYPAWNESKEGIERGKSLFFDKYACQSCHIVNGKGGYVGPPLDNSGNRLKPGWIESWLSNPQKYIPETIEPRTGMSRKDALDIAQYLMTLKKEN
jgi:mono/diheme cytochrome c family protein